MADAPSSVHTPASGSPSAHGSHSAGAKAGPAAPKDRACPYCHINFTSSSLGRHLDLYIKEKNPKPPDGIHNVEEIRKSRSGITRRQARSSRRSQHDRSRGSTTNGAINDSASPTGSQVDRKPTLTHAFRNIFNTPHWTSTGVITDSDANQQFMNGDGGVPLVETPGSGTGMDHADRRKLMEERERGRAAELALQELIESIKAASSQDNHPDPYDFDFFACSFPELCLQILSPSAILERHSFVTENDSWTTDPPDEPQYRALQHKVRNHLFEWREVYFPPNPRKRPRTDSPGRPDDPDSLEPNPLYQHHLTLVWNQWMTLPMMKKGADWHVAVMRAFANEARRHSETKKRLEYAETELNRARLDNARLTECQMPREWLHSPATQLPLAKLAAEKVERELRKGGLDAEKLIAKWRPRVQAARTFAKDEPGELASKARLMMIGPAGTDREVKRQSDMSRAGCDGREPSEDVSDYDDEDGEEEDEEDEPDTNSRHNAGHEAVHSTNGSITPSLRHQMGAYASTDYSTSYARH